MKEILQILEKICMFKNGTHCTVCSKEIGTYKHGNLDTSIQKSVRYGTSHERLKVCPNFQHLIWYRVSQ